jgi:hypothetical protein
MVTMPERFIQKTIRDLSIGEQTLTVPWALYLDDKRQCWLNGNYSQHSMPGGTVQMKVTHTEQGYVCDISRCKEYAWSDGSGPAAWGDPIAIVQLIGGER